MIGWWLLIAAMVALVAWGFSRSARSSPAVGVEHLLAERYARGEIDETEYRTRLAVIKGHR